MFLGRNTAQWTALFSGIAALVAAVVAIVDPAQLSVVGALAAAIAGFASLFVAFLANTSLTPTGDPRLPSGTSVTIIDGNGKPTGQTVTT